MRAQEANRSYRATQVQTASDGELIIMLYDGAIRWTNRAHQLMEEQAAPQEIHQTLVRSQDIVGELMGSLNMDAGEVAAGLFRLYEYMNYLLIQANLKKDPKPLQEVVGMLQELREAWAKVVHEQKTASEPGANGAAYQERTPVGDTVMRLSLET